MSRLSSAARPVARLAAALLLAAPLLAAPLLAAPLLAAPPAELPEGFFDAFAYRYVGPVGNRVPAVAGDPSDPAVYYAGAASGGIFKTADGGTTWKPIFDDQEVSSIGALAVAPSDSNVVWAGTGESFIRANISIGNGVYRSTDGGAHWQHRGLEASGRIARIAVHPADPDVAFAAALGHTYGPQPERGLYRTTDGGETWQQVLFVDQDTGAVDVVIDPRNPRILFAATWTIRVWTAGRTSGGPGSGIYTSRDGGDTWTRLEGKGLPTGPWGKIGLAMSAADPDRVYALIETSSNSDFAPSDPFQGVLWRSDDGGESWSMISADNDLAQRPLYYSRAMAAPDDADEIHFLAVRHTRSIDGGRTVERVDAGWDHHDMWIDPRRPERMIVGHDGGVSISINRGETWARPQLPIAQMYHVATDRRIPYNLFGNRQDGPSTSGPSNSLDGRTIPIGAWRSVGGCEVGFAIPSPADDDIVWSGCYDGILERHDRKTGHSRNVSVWPEVPESWAAADLRFRFQWTFPLAISPHDPRAVFVGSQHVHRTVDGGQSWTVISPDLTTDDPALQARAGGLTLDDAGPTLAPTIFALAPSPHRPDELWAGTNDGQVQVTRDGGTTWSNLTAGLPDLPPLGTVSNIEPSPHDPATVYLTVDRHQENDRATYVYRSRDGGQSWQSIRGDLPQGLFSYAHCVREDPVRPELLYLGTENALWLSWDGGGHWHRLRSNLPPAPVHWLEIQPHFNDLVVATYGRGFWILDDVTPLQQLDAATLDAQAHLFAPRPAYRFRFKDGPMQQPNDPAAGSNPDYGASLHYWLKEKTEDDVELAILDADGEVVRTLDDVKAEAGIHRLTWDLRSDRSTEVKLRTKPDENPHIALPDSGWRELSDGGRQSYLLPPGTYTVRLTVGETTATAPVEVRKDPHSAGTEADIAAQTAVVRDLWHLTDQAARTINGLEWIRRQLADLRTRLDQREAAGVEAVVQAIDALEDEIKALESAYFDLRLTSAVQDTLRWQRRLYAKLAYLAWGIGSSDYPPTDQQMAVYRQLQAEAAEHQQTADALRGERLAAFNAVLRDAGVDGVIVP